ncbi:MAG: VOC family protein [Candidatus Poribacteria bacterium]|nr:VOC family protein [Candidatus Poribacteria bacterium]
MGNPVVHFEISGKDGEALSEFYRSAFGWNINYNTHGIYSVDPESENGVDGHIFTTTDDTCSTNGVTIYIEVDDLQATLEKAESIGGQTLVPPRAIPSGMGSFAMFLDPSGNCIGLYAPEQNVPHAPHGVHPNKKSED